MFGLPHGWCTSWYPCSKNSLKVPLPHFPHFQRHYHDLKTSATSSDVVRECWGPLFSMINQKAKMLKYLSSRSSRKIQDTLSSRNSKERGFSTFSLRHQFETVLCDKKTRIKRTQNREVRWVSKSWSSNSNHADLKTLICWRSRKSKTINTPRFFTNGRINETAICQLDWY